MVRLLLLAAHTRLLLRLLLLARGAAGPMVWVMGVYGTHARAWLRGAASGVQVGVIIGLGSSEYCGIMGMGHHASLTHACHYMLAPTVGPRAHGRRLTPTLAAHTQHTPSPTSHGELKHTPLHLGHLQKLATHLKGGSTSYTPPQRA